MSVVSFRFTFFFGDRLEAVTADHAVSFIGVNGTGKAGVGSSDTGDTIIAVTVLPVVVYFLNVVALATVEVVSPFRKAFLSSSADHICFSFLKRSSRSKTLFPSPFIGRSVLAWISFSRFQYSGRWVYMFRSSFRFLFAQHQQDTRSSMSYRRNPFSSQKYPPHNTGEGRRLP